MAKITITLEDRENGHVHIESNPDIEILLRAIKDKYHRTPAEGYAAIALGAMVNFSGQVAKEIANLSHIASKIRLQ